MSVLILYYYRGLFGQKDFEIRILQMEWVTLLAIVVLQNSKINITWGKLYQEIHHKTGVLIFQFGGGIWI